MNPDFIVDVFAASLWLLLMIIVWHPLVFSLWGFAWDYVNDVTYEWSCGPKSKWGNRYGSLICDKEAKYRKGKDFSEEIWAGFVASVVFSASCFALSFATLALLISLIALILFPVVIWAALRTLRFLIRTKKAVGALANVAHKHNSNENIEKVEINNLKF